LLPVKSGVLLPVKSGVLFPGSFGFMTTTVTRHPMRILCGNSELTE